MSMPSNDMALPLLGTTLTKAQTLPLAFPLLGATSLWIVNVIAFPCHSHFCLCFFHMFPPFAWFLIHRFHSNWWHNFPTFGHHSDGFPIRTWRNLTFSHKNLNFSHKSLTVSHKNLNFSHFWDSLQTKTIRTNNTKSWKWLLHLVCYFLTFDCLILYAVLQMFWTLSRFGGTPQPLPRGRQCECLVSKSSQTWQNSIWNPNSFPGISQMGT